MVSLNLDLLPTIFDESVPLVFALSFLLCSLVVGSISKLDSRRVEIVG